MTDQSFVASLLRHYAYRRGTFKLASGQESDEYLDVKGALLNPIAGRAVATAVARFLVEKSMSGCVAGVGLGGAILASLVSQAAWEHGLCWPALAVREVDRDHGLGHTVEGLVSVPRVARDNVPEPDWPCCGPLVFVEDVVTTGASVQKGLAAVMGLGEFRLRAVVTVVDRQRGGLADLERRHPGTLVAAVTTLDRVRSAGPPEEHPAWAEAGRRQRLVDDVGLRDAWSPLPA